MFVFELSQYKKVELTKVQWGFYFRSNFADPTKDWTQQKGLTKKLQGISLLLRLGKTYSSLCHTIFVVSLVHL